MKLKDTLAQNSFDYAYLTRRMYKYIKPYMFRIVLGFLIALPVGALDGVIAYALKPYMDEVLIKKNNIHHITFNLKTTGSKMVCKN